MWFPIHDLRAPTLDDMLPLLTVCLLMMMGMEQQDALTHVAAHLS